MLHLEVQRGKNGMKNARYHKEYGATTSCTLRMGEACVSSNEGHMDTLYSDSWFASVQTAEASLKELNCHFIGHLP